MNNKAKIIDQAWLESQGLKFNLNNNALERIQAKGFGFMKFELEAHLDRPDGESSDNCYECSGDGYFDCANPVHNMDREPNPGELCPDSGCHGGRIDCNACDGLGYHENDGWNDDACEQWLRDHVSTEALEALVYGRFYNDGSVDSEFTFTLPTLKAGLALEFISAFKALANEIGNGMDTSGAGFHISVLNDPDGRYPCRTYLDSDKLQNFKREVSHLLPALYFLASPDHTSRPLSYRHPRIDEDKYSAIHVMAGGFEYRVFETCYNRPEALSDYFEVIANTLKFYAKTVKSPAKIRPFRLPNGNDSVGRFFQTPDAIQALTATLPVLKPKTKTIARLCSERNFKLLGKAELAKKQAKVKAKLEADYAEYIERHKQAMRDNARYMIGQSGYIHDPYAPLWLSQACLAFRANPDSFEQIYADILPNLDSGLSLDAYISRYTGSSSGDLIELVA